MMTVLYRIGMFLLLLLISPMWVFVGIWLAFTALIGTFDPYIDEAEVEENGRQ